MARHLLNLTDMPNAPLVALRPVLPPPTTETTRQRIVALAFDTPDKARDALLAAARLQEQGQLVLHDAVFVSCSDDSPDEVIETRDPTPIAAAVPSSLFGALVGTLVAGPLGFLIGGVLAGGTGALVAKLVDTGIPDQAIRELRDLAKPHQTILALLVSDWSAGAVVEELHRFQGAHVVYAELPAAAIELVRQALRDN